MRVGRDQLSDARSETHGSIRDEQVDLAVDTRVRETSPERRRLDVGIGQSATLHPSIAVTKENSQNSVDAPTQLPNEGDRTYREVSLTDGVVYEQLCDFCYVNCGRFFSVDAFRKHLKQQGILLGNVKDGSINTYFSRKAKNVAAALSAQHVSRFVAVPLDDEIVISEIIIGKRKPAATEEQTTEATQAVDEIPENHSYEAHPTQPPEEDYDEELPVDSVQKPTNDQPQEVQDVIEDEKLPAEHPVESEPAEKQTREARDHEASRVVYIEKARKACVKCLTDHGGVMTRRSLVNLISLRQPKISAYSYQVIDGIVARLIKRGDLISFEEARIEMVAIAPENTET